MIFNRIFSAQNPLILASASLARAAILRDLKIPHEIVPSNFAEKIPAGKISPTKISKFFAIEKARAIAPKFDGKIILGADTLVVSAAGKILRKPKNKTEAMSFLRARSNSFEKVFSAVALLKNGKLVSGVSRSTIFYGEIPENFAREFLDFLDFKNRAGALSVGGRGAFFVKKIVGDFYGTIGLPIFLFGKLLGKLEK